MRTLLGLLLMLPPLALANVPPAPLPPRDKKFVEVKSEVLLGKDVTGYVFVFHEKSNPRSEPGDRFSRAKLSATTPYSIAPTGGRGSQLVAVPEDVAKAYTTDDELFAALRDNKLKGTHTLGTGGGGSTLVDETATTEKAVTWTYTITVVDPKKGIKWNIKGIGTEGSPNAEEKLPAKQKDGSTRSEPGAWVSGGAATLALVLGGLWLSGRSRRKPT